jgi:hypothetical protein
VKMVVFCCPWASWQSQTPIHFSALRNG